MTKLAQFAEFITTAQNCTFTAMDGNSRLEAVKNFYNSKGLDLPGSITVTTTKNVAYLSKDDRNAINERYINALENDCMTDEIKNNRNAVKSGNGSVTTSTTESYREAVKTFGASVVAAKLIDALSVSDNEEFHKIRKFEVPASVAISEIPAFIKELQKIYDAAKVESEKESK